MIEIILMFVFIAIYICAIAAVVGCMVKKNIKSGYGGLV